MGDDSKSLKSNSNTNNRRSSCVKTSKSNKDVVDDSNQNELLNNKNGDNSDTIKTADSGVGADVDKENSYSSTNGLEIKADLKMNGLNGNPSPVSTEVPVNTNESSENTISSSITNNLSPKINV